MMKNIFFVITAFLSLFLSSCTKSEISDEITFSEEEQKIFGEWKIFHTSGGFSGQGVPLENLEFDHLAIEQPDKFGYLKNNQLVDQGIISPMAKKANDSRLMVKFSNSKINKDFNQEKYVVFKGDDTMSLQSTGNDMIDFHFVRIQ